MQDKRKHIDHSVVTPPLKKRRNAAMTIQSIQEAAAEIFFKKNYDAVGLREIAKKAGIDVALIGRYFGSKEKLYTETLEKAADAINLKKLILKAPLESLGKVLAHTLFEETACRYIQIYLRSAIVDTTAPIFAQIMEETFCRPLAKRIGGKDAKLRAEIIHTHIFGVSTGYYLMKLETMTNTDKQIIEDHLAGIIQSYIGNP
jgi:AcrR family transcriptional regulator